MYIKEFRDTLKVLVQSSLIFLVIPVMMMLDWHVFHTQWELSGIFQPVFLAFLIVFTAYSGVSIFQVEKKERALEYMFSLPLSKKVIMAGKILPRLAVLTPFILLAVLTGVLENPAADILTVLIFFVSGVCISLAVESMVNAVVGVIFINIIIYYGTLITAYLFFRAQMFANEAFAVILAQFLATAAVLVPLITAFVKTVRHFDLKPLKWQARSYLTIALPALAAVILYVLIFLKQYLAWIKLTG